MGGILKTQVSVNAKASGNFSLMIDSTQDISAYEQCAVVLRFVTTDPTSPIDEKLLAVYRLSSTTGEGYLAALQNELQKCGLDIGSVVGCSFDGALNMRGSNTGLQARLKEINPNLVYTWCYAHVMNLVICDMTSSVLAAKNLFRLLERTYAFFSESNKRVLEWDKLTQRESGRTKLIRLERMAKTRWYSKERGLKKLFKGLNNPTEGIYKLPLEFLHNLNKSNDFDVKVSSDARALFMNWCEMETILTALTFLRIFEYLGPTSKYLQTKGLNLVCAATLVKNSLDSITAIRNDFAVVREKAVGLAQYVNATFGDDVSVFVEETLPIKRVRKRKKQYSELAPDEPVEDVWKNYEVTQYLCICDTTEQKLRERYTSNEELMSEVSYFQPSNFSKLSRESNISFTNLSKNIGVDSQDLLAELMDFSSKFPTLIKELGEATTPESPSTTQAYGQAKDSDESEDDEDESDEESRICQLKKKSCQNCVTCCYKLLHKYNLHAAAYLNIYQAYKYILTLPSTQVECERTFSKLKIVKSRLRASLTQEILEALLLMAVEREMTEEISLDQILYEYSNSSSELKRKLD